MLYILDRKQRTVGVASNSSPLALPYWDDLHTENLEGVETYSFMVPSDHPDAGKLVTNGHIVFQDLDGKFRMHTIKEVSDTYFDFNKQAKEIRCESTAITELLSDIVRPFKRSQTDIETLVETILNSANNGWEIGDIEYATTSTFEIKEHMTVLEALRYLTYEVFFKEMYFTVKMRGTEIVKKEINIVEQRGEETDIRFDYGINLRGVSRSENTDELATALIGLGKADSSGKRINLFGVAAFDDGDLFKEAGTDWIGSESAFQNFNTGGGHLFGIHIDDEADTVDRLLSSTKNALNYRKVPLVIYSAAVEDLERYTGYGGGSLRLGDRIVINDKTFDPPITISGRVMELIRSYTDPTKDSIDLGRYKKLTVGVPAEVKKLQNVISQNEEKWNANVYKVEIVSSGGNVFRNGTGESTLTAKLYQASEEIDTDGTLHTYKWYKYDSTGTLITNWGGGGLNYKTGKTLTVSGEEVSNKATFYLEVE